MSNELLNLDSLISIWYDFKIGYGKEGTAMKQSLSDLLRLVSPDPEHPLEMTDDEVMRVLPLKDDDRRRDFVMRRFGLCGQESQSYSRIAAGCDVSVRYVHMGIGMAVARLRGRIRMNTIHETGNVRGTRIADLDLSTRTTNCLQRAGIEYLSQLTDVHEAYLLGIWSFGSKCLAEVRAVAEAAGIKFRGRRATETTPEMSIADLVSQQSLRRLAPSGLVTLADVAELVKGQCNADDPFWQISNQDLGVVFFHLAAAGLL
jgi:hypothetical protein